MSPQRTIMVALGGNALAPKGEEGTIAQQFARTRESLDGIMHFVNLDYNICITHGNGPQPDTALRNAWEKYQDAGGSRHYSAGCRRRWYTGV